MNAKVSYALLRNDWDGTTKKVPLPLTIGSSATCDVVINAVAVAEEAYRVQEVEGALRISRSQDETPLAPDIINRYGLVISGPVVKGPGSKFRQALREWPAREALFFQRAPKIISLLLGGGLSFKGRYGLLALAIILFTGIPRLQEPEATIDLSQTPIPLAIDRVTSTIVGYTVRRAGHEKGGLMIAQASDEQSKMPFLLSFQAAKLDMADEVIIAINGTKVFASSPMPNCLTRFCPVKIRLPAGTLQAGENTIKIVHNPEGGYYILGQMLLQALPKITPTERERVELWEQVANRAYNDRDIVADNLVRAQNELEKALAFLDTRDGAEDLRNRLEAFQLEAKQAFNQEVKDLWAKVAVNEKLKKFEMVRHHLEKLRSLYPDTSSKENLNIQNRLAQLKESL